MRKKMIYFSEKIIKFILNMRKKTKKTLFKDIKFKFYVFK